MNESELTGYLKDSVKRVMRWSVPLKHADKFNSGVPDLSVTWRGITSWWEVKLYDERPFESPHIQRVTCARLSVQGICNYVIYASINGLLTVRVVHPAHLDKWKECTEFAQGFNHRWIANRIRVAHLNRLGDDA